MNCLWQQEKETESESKRENRKERLFHQICNWARTYTQIMCLFLLFRESMFPFSNRTTQRLLFMLPLCSGRIWKCQRPRRTEASEKELSKNKTSINKRKIPIELPRPDRSLWFDYFENGFCLPMWSHVNFGCCMCCFMFRFFSSDEEDRERVSPFTRLPVPVIVKR